MKEHDELDKLLYDFVGTASVSGFETRAYEWLIRDYWLPYRENLSPEIRHKLFITKTNSHQLMVTWEGDVSSKRHLVYVAHVDREGYRLSFASDRLLLVDVTQNPPDINRLGKKICIVCDFDGTPKIISVATITKITNGTIPGYEIAINSGVCESELTNKLTNGVVISAHHYFERSLEQNRCIDRKGIIYSSCIDNACGVAAATSALREVIEQEIESTVSCLYTIGEEVLFYGGYMAGKDWEELRRHEGQEITACVIDASDIRKSYRLSLGGWTQDMSSENRIDLIQEKAGTVYANVPATRLEDQMSIFDYYGAAQLSKAALMTRSRLTRNTEWNNICTARTISRLGMAGVFWGGVCDATAIRIGRVQSGISGNVSRHRDTVPVLALPMVNYRFATSRSGIAPEGMRYSTIALAREILIDLAKTTPHELGPPVGKADLGHLRSSTEQSFLRPNNNSYTEENLSLLLETNAVEKTNDYNELLGKWWNNHCEWNDAAQ